MHALEVIIALNEKAAAEAKAKAEAKAEAEKAEGEIVKMPSSCTACACAG